jgi:uncharacterized protein (TIGR02679 family)
VTGLLDPRLEPLWQALHRRYGEGGRAVATVTVSGLDHHQLEALADLLREPELRPSDTKVPTGKLAAALRVDSDGLRALVEHQLGPAGNRAAARDAAAAARTTAADELAAHAGDDVLAAWARRQAVGTGEVLTDRVATVRRILDVVTAARPVPVPLPIVAAETFGDPHALDPDRPAGRMLAAALAERAGTVDTSARTRRQLLRGISIVADELSSTVIAYRLPVRPDHPLSGALTGAEPAAVTLSQLLCHPIQVTDDPVAVRVVENPAVVSAAALRNSRLALVCTSGMPSVAALELVTQLTGQGVQVRAHADFDAAGLTIVTQLIAVGAAPWMMDATHYRRAAGRSDCQLDPVPADVSWDVALAEVMRTDGRVGFEEHLLEELLDNSQMHDL